MPWWQMKVASLVSRRCRRRRRRSMAPVLALMWLFTGPNFYPCSYIVLMMMWPGWRVAARATPR